MNLSGKVAMVTGSSRGIGKAVALKLAQAGADLIVTATSLERAEKTADEINALGRKALAVKVDVSNASDVEALFAKTSEEFGRLDFLVNNAGITRDGLLMRMKFSAAVVPRPVDCHVLAADSTGRTGRRGATAL